MLKFDSFKEGTISALKLQFATSKGISLVSLMEITVDVLLKTSQLIKPFKICPDLERAGIVKFKD